MVLANLTNGIWATMDGALGVGRGAKVVTEADGSVAGKAGAATGVAGDTMVGMVGTGATTVGGGTKSTGWDFEEA
jgi:hypothetical protein